MTIVPSSVPVRRLLRAAATGLRWAVDAAAARYADAGLGSGDGTPGDPRGPGPGSVWVTGVGRGSTGSGHAVCAVPSPGPRCGGPAAAAGSRGRKVRAGVGSGSSVSGRVGRGAALLRPHVNLRCLAVIFKEAVYEPQRDSAPDFRPGQISIPGQRCWKKTKETNCPLLRTHQPGRSSISHPLLQLVMRGKV